MADNATIELGFVCPEWAIPHWNPAECTIIDCTDGTVAVIDHSLNGVTVFAAKTRRECSEFLAKEQ